MIHSNRRGCTKNKQAHSDTSLLTTRTGNTEVGYIRHREEMQWERGKGERTCAGGVLRNTS